MLGGGDVSHFDTYVLYLENSECLFFDILEGVVEAVCSLPLTQTPK